MSRILAPGAPLAKLPRVWRGEQDFGVRRPGPLGRRRCMCAVTLHTAGEGVHEGVCIRDTRGVRRVRECVWVALRPARAARVPRAPRGPHCLTLIAREARTRSVLEAVHSRGPCGVRRVRECARVARAPRAGLRTSISQVRAA